MSASEIVEMGIRSALESDHAAMHRASTSLLSYDEDDVSCAMTRARFGRMADEHLAFVCFREYHAIMARRLR